MTAAVALLRSVATKLARAPQLRPRPPLGRGLHGGAPSGVGGSLTLATSNGMIQQGMEGMAAVSKIARAQPPHPNPGASSFTPPPPPPPINKDLIIEDLRRRLSIACAAAGIGAATITGTVVYLYFWVKPDVEAHSSGHGKRTSVEELAEGIKGIRAKVEEQGAKQAAFREDSQAALAKLKAAVESLRSKPEEESVCLRGFNSGSC